MHGKTSDVYHKGDPLFTGVPSPFTATRYHSLIVEEPLPEGLRVTGLTEQGEVMGLRHRGASCNGRPVSSGEHPDDVRTAHFTKLY